MEDCISFYDSTIVQDPCSLDGRDGVPSIIIDPYFEQSLQSMVPGSKSLFNDQVENEYFLEDRQRLPIDTGFSEYNPGELDVAGIGSWLTPESLSAMDFDDMSWNSDLESSRAVFQSSKRSRSGAKSISGDSIRSDDELPHSCTICFDSFKTLDDLEHHAKDMQHRIYVCKEIGCGKDYCRRDSYTRHKMKHKGSLRHVCKLCDKAFGRKDHLHQHMKNVHVSSHLKPDYIQVSRPTSPTSSGDDRPKFVQNDHLSGSEFDISHHSYPPDGQEVMRHFMQVLGPRDRAVKEVEHRLSMRGASLAGLHSKHRLPPLPLTAERPRNIKAMRRR